MLTLIKVAENGPSGLTLATLRLRNPRTHVRTHINVMIDFFYSIIEDRCPRNSQNIMSV